MEKIRGMDKPEGYDNPYERTYAERGQFWPLPGDKVTFMKVHMIWFTNMIRDAEELLIPGAEYTIKTVAVASSWCGITLEEIARDDEHLKFPLSFFKYDRIPDVPALPNYSNPIFDVEIVEKSVDKK
jgi:hypothetical protein